MISWLQSWLEAHGVVGWAAESIVLTGAVAVILLSSLMVNYIFRGPVLSALTRLLQRSEHHWCIALQKRRVLNRCVYLAPVMTVYRLAPWLLGDYVGLVNVLISSMTILMFCIALLVIDALLDTLVEIYEIFPASREIPIKGFVQALKVVFYCMGGIFIVSVLVDQTPLYLISGLGAVTAVLLLVFKDPLLGFVAGIQLTANRMVNRGDWIEMPKYGADGDVVEVALTTVKVQNWDKTITTIPTYALITDSFKNWRGMAESGGRRIKRAIYIDVNTVRFCTEEMLSRFAQIHYIAEYIEEKKREISDYNSTHQVDISHLVNGRKLTNIGTFRAYIEAYLRNHPMINNDMTCMVRQRDPGQSGLPLEIYAFSLDQVWINYEAIQADIFDHILAVITEFDLQIHQNPTGQDFASLLNVK